MPTAQVVMDRIRTITGDINKAQFSDTEIINWINDAQFRLISRTETNQEHFVELSVANTRTYFLPPGFTKVRDVHVNGLLVNPATLEEINQMYPDNNSTLYYPSGQPLYYWIDTAQSVGYNLQLYPAPAQSGWNIEGLKIQTPTNITSGTTTLSVLDFQVETLVLMCLQRAKEWDTDYDGARYFDIMAEKRMGEESYNHAVRQMESYPNVRQVSSDQW